MNILWIILGVVLGIFLLLLLALLFGKAKIRIVCQGSVRVVASILGIRFTLYPEKEEKENKRAKKVLRCSNPDRILKKELRKQQRAARKARRKKLKAKAKLLQKRSRKAVAQQPDPNLIENLQMVFALVKRFYALTRGNVRIRVSKMHISVATDDVAKTAVVYGTVVQSAAYLLQWIETHFNHIEREDGDMTITPDYLSETTTSDIDISFSIGVSKAIKIALGMLASYKIEKRKAYQKAKKRNGKRSVFSKLLKLK